MGQSQLPIWVQYLQALGPVFVALAVGGLAWLVAWRQWRTANYRLCFDLFEKRYAIYVATKSLVQKVAVHGQISFGDLGEYQRTIEGAEFLFDGETRSYFKSIIDLCFKAQMARRKQDRKIDQQTLEKLVDEEEEIWTWLQTQGPHLENMMRRYLDLSKVGV
jgi:hypothetical protein